MIVDVEERHAWTLGSFKWKLRIRTVGDEGREFTAMVDTFDLLGNFPHAGDIWPIRFGAGGDSKADIDLPSLQAEIRAERERIEAEHLRLGLERAAKEEAGPPQT